MRPSPTRVAHRYLEWQIIAAQIVDVDKFRGSVQHRRDEAVKAVAILARGGKKPIWVIDVGGALQGYRDFGKDIADDCSGYFNEASAYASEAQDHEEESQLNALSDKWSRTRFKINPVVSPRSGKPGYKITW